MSDDLRELVIVVSIMVGGTITIVGLPIFILTIAMNNTPCHSTITQLSSDSAYASCEEGKTLEISRTDNQTLVKCLCPVEGK